MSTPAVLKPALRRSACDPCRAKRVRCLRAHDSMAPCARCCYLGASCVTGAPGHPGRPPKRRRALADSELIPTPTPAAVHSHAPRDPLAHTPQPDVPDNIWTGLGDSSTFSALLDYPLLDQSPAPSEETRSLQDRQSNPLNPLQQLLCADDEHNDMLDMGGDSSSSGTAFDMDMDLLLGYGLHNGDGVMDAVLPPTSRPRPQSVSAARSLVALREEIDERIAAVDAYYADPVGVQQRCQDEAEGPGCDVDHPPAALLTCSKKLIDILQTLTPTASSEDTLSTEILLLALSSYLAFMRLFDALFHRIHQAICRMQLLPPVSFASLKVKSVLRIGGVSALQDMPLKAYASGILEAIYGHVRTLERCLGIPAEHCLRHSGEDSAPTTPGLFSRVDRARLFAAVMAQEDVQSRQGGKSYVESIRANIKESLAFLDD